MSPTEPVREFFSMGDVCTLTDLKPHVLRYWESQFRFLHPAKNRSGNRVYQRREIELIMLVRQLLYTEKYTIDGARQKIDEYRKSGELRSAARAARGSRASTWTTPSISASPSRLTPDWLKASTTRPSSPGLFSVRRTVMSRPTRRTL